MTCIASVDFFVCGITISNRSMSALRLNHGNGEFIVHEYNGFENFYIRGPALLRSRQHSLWSRHALWCRPMVWLTPKIIDLITAKSHCRQAAVPAPTGSCPGLFENLAAITAASPPPANATVLSTGFA